MCVRVLCLQPPCLFLFQRSDLVPLSDCVVVFQGAAVRDVLTRESKVGLIQGPPGTGKTQTLIAMLSIIYTRLREQQQQRALQQQQQLLSASAPRGGGGGARDVVSSPGFSRGLKRKILVCAPSNAAVDEIAERLLLHGLQHPMTGEIFRPACIRIGMQSSTYP